MRPFVGPVAGMVRPTGEGVRRGGADGDHDTPVERPYDAVTRRLLEEPGVLASRILRATSGEDRTTMERRDLLKRVFDQLAFLELSVTRAA